MVCGLIDGVKFQSTLPVGGATQREKGQSRAEVFQSTLPVGGATLTYLLIRMCNYISIHAPRGGSDDTVSTENKVTVIISIHAPRGGSDEGDVNG